MLSPELGVAGAREQQRHAGDLNFNTGAHVSIHCISP